jgi:hypothetical protein
MSRPLLHPAGPRFFHLTQKSLLRANVASLGGLGLAFLLSGFPHIVANPLVAVPLLFALLGATDAARCMQVRWSFYHGAVILSLYMDILIVTLILFFLLWPYFHWLL